MKLLWIDSSVRPPHQSRTHQLALAYLAQLPEETEVTHLVLRDLPLSPLTASDLTLRDALIAKGDFSHPMFALARQFAQADRIIISAPYWDLSCPAILKLYVERITVSGLTYSHFPPSLCRADRLVYLTTAGGFLQDDCGPRYFQSLCAQLYHISQVDVVAAQGLDIDPNETQALLSQGIASAKALAEQSKFANPVE